MHERERKRASLLTIFLARPNRWLQPQQLIVALARRWLQAVETSSLRLWPKEHKFPAAFEWALLAVNTNF